MKAQQIELIADVLADLPTSLMKKELKNILWCGRWQNSDARSIEEEMKLFKNDMQLAKGKNNE